MLRATAIGTPTRSGCPGGRASGYTLIEVGLVILLLGTMAILVSDFYINQLGLNKDTRRVAGTVRDMQTLIDASVLWAEAHGRWPNDANMIAVEPLVAAGFLTDATRPGNRYAECVDCDDYALLGWDRDVVGADGKGDYTSVASDADDLVLRVQIWGRADAELIAGQLPQGHAVAVEAGQASAGAFTVEARVFEGGIRTGNFVRVQRENRPVVFAAETQSHNVQGGDLQRIGRITGSKQRPPCRPGQNPLLDNCHSATSVYVTEGSAIMFQERPCELGEDPSEDGCRVACPPGLPKLEGDACHAGPVLNQPAILLRDEVRQRMCAGDVGASDPGCDLWDARSIGPAVVLHGTPRSSPRAPGPVLHLLAETSSGYAKVRVMGGLEIERAPGFDSRTHPRPAYRQSWQDDLPSSRDVVTQSELDWLQCCLANLELNTGTVIVSCEILSVRACVRERVADRLAAGP